MPTPKKSDNTGIVPPAAGGSELAATVANDAPQLKNDAAIEIPREEEWHVTVAGASPVDWERLCMEVGVTPLFIELNDRRLQLMSAIEDKFGFDLLMNALTKHEEFKVLRIKHEVRSLKPGEDPLYFEAHVKFDGDYRFDLKAASRDLYRLDPARWYVTWRGLPVRKTVVSTVTVKDQNGTVIDQEVTTEVTVPPFTAKDLRTQYENLENATRKIAAIETEWVLTDTNRALDDGWI